MGEVYRARDAKLQRDVAIKILRDATLDADRLARFEREARVLAALNHPNIGAIYGFEQTGDVGGLVLELVEGPTLADRLLSGPIPLGEALRIARDIADALDAAHSKGIVHRDLKPANIKVATSGAVKVLDFGLAKIDDGGDSGGDLSHSPTVTVAGTRDGVILGTAGYMSPEQARGKPLDKRTDIWSFGCILYEMLTGRQAFAGETVSDSIAAILSREPEWAPLDDTLPQVRRLLARCLDKDANERLRDIGDARQELDHVLADRREGGVARPVVGARRLKRPVWWSGAAVAGALAIAAAGVFVSMRRPASAPSAPEPPVQLTFFNDSALLPSLSPDGRMMTFIRGGAFASSAPRGQVYVKILPNGEPVQLTRDQSVKAQPVFSPDGSRIIYTAAQSFKWDSWQVPVLGGAPQLFLPNASGLIWLDDRRLIYSEIMGAGVHMGIVTSTESRADSRAIYFPRGEAGMAHRSARSPDGKSVLVVEMDGGEWLPCRLIPVDGSSTGRAVGPLDGQCTTAAWSPDGAWMYFTSNSGGRFHIWRQRYPDGRPEPITSDPTEQEGTAITPDGRYLITSMGLQQASIVLREPAGEQPLTSEVFAMMPTMMPGGDRMFYLVRQGSRGFVTGELWSMSPTTGERTRVLPGHLMANYSISADGRRVVFASTGGEAGNGIWIADLDRRTPPRQLARGPEFRAFFGAPGEVVYMDGSQRRMYRMKDDGTDVRVVSPDPIINVLTVSPDGRWAVVLAPDPGGSTKIDFVSLVEERTVPVCCAMGFGPDRRLGAPLYNWSPDGKSLFVALQSFPLGTAKTVVLPYRSGVPFDVQWPRGFKSEDDVVGNPGARVINESNVFPASKPGEYLRWTRSTQSNLYQIALPK
jgi:Tol biopolymer transport system component